MKVILSRKGFDSSYGAQPSPILPDGTLLSLPIPYNRGILFSEPKYNNESYLDIIKQLRPRTNIDKNTYCHLDPDIRIEAKARNENWKGLYGQSGAAQTHLDNMNVDIDDVFLFFGWFKKTEMTEKGLRYIKNAPDLHVIFGYFQIGEKYKERTQKITNIEHHPHANFDEKNDCIYEASNELSFINKYKGYGCLSYNDDLVLSKSGMPRSKWQLPEIFKELQITYHNKNSFKNDFFQSAAKGQEFIIKDGNLIIDWVKNIIVKGTKHNNLN